MDGCLSPYGSVGEPREGGPFTVNCERYWKEGSGNGTSLFMRALSGEPGGAQESSGDGHLFLWGPHWETWERAHILGAYVWKKVLGRVSLRIGASLGDLVRGSPSIGNFKRSLKGL